MTLPRRLFFCGFLLTAWLLSTAGEPRVDGLPFHTGEKLTYRISWSNILDAGTAELSVGPSAKVANALKLELKASTAPAIAATYPFTDEFASHFDPVLGAPSLFEKNFTEKKRVVREKVVFNQVHRQATFTNSKNQSKKVAIELGTQDPVSALYVLRRLGLNPGVQIAFQVLDGGRLYSVEAKVAGTELMTTRLGNFNASRVEVSLRKDGAEVSDKRITIWFTTDSRRVPILASVALPVGAAVIELTGQAHP